MELTLEYRKAIIKTVHTLEAPQKFVIGNLTLLLNKWTLVPHPDTITLIDLAANTIKSHPDIQTIADVGTGSGFIALSLAQIFPDKKIIASDISEKVIDIAQKNAELNNSTNIEFRINTNNQWLHEFSTDNIDCVVSNPPFVGTAEYNSAEFQTMYPEVQLEPVYAIKTKDSQGIEPYRNIMMQGKEMNIRYFIFQCNSLHIQQCAQEAKIIYKEPIIDIRKDDNGNNRFLLVSI